MSKQAWIIFAAICVVIFSAIIVLNKNSSVDVGNADPTKIQTGAMADHVQGNADAKIIFVEYGDYECPYCGQAFPQVKSITNTYSSQVAFVFRNYPLTSIHPNALAAATAAEAAGKQGKFWEMHDMLYQNQNSWVSASADQRDGVFQGYAQTLGLDVDQFKKDELDKSINDKINFDQALGTKQQVSGTPAFYLNGQALDTATSQDIINGSGSKLISKLNDLIKQDGGTPPKS